MLTLVGRFGTAEYGPDGCYGGEPAPFAGGTGRGDDPHAVLERIEHPGAQPARGTCARRSPHSAVREAGRGGAANRYHRGTGDRPGAPPPVDAVPASGLDVSG